MSSMTSVGIDCFFFFFQAEDGIRDLTVTGVQTCALPISLVDGADERATVDRVAHREPHLRVVEGRLLDVHDDVVADVLTERGEDRKSTRLNSSHSQISYAVFCLKKKTTHTHTHQRGCDIV